MSLIQNKKVNLEYKITDKISFGISLLGPEVKSLRAKLGSLDGARVVVANKELQLVGSFIPIYQEKNNPNLNAYRTRKLLANKTEILKINDLKTGANIHLIPISIYLKGNIMKLECGFGTRLKKQDKREVIRKKDEKYKDL